MNVEEAQAMYSTVSGSVPGQISDSQVLSLLRTKEIDWKYISTIKNLTDFNDDIISEWLNISVRTFRSYQKPNAKFKENFKEHLLLLISLIKHGVEVFGTKEKFDRWLSMANFFFDKKAPASFLSTVSGIRFVDDSLTGMQYGDNV